MIIIYGDKTIICGDMMRRGLGIVILIACIALTWAQMRGCNVRVTPTPAPTPKAQSVGYVYTFPVIGKFGKTQLTGHGLVALNGERYADKLEAEWCYIYEYYDVNTRINCYTKIVHFTTPSTCPAILFLGNEPNNSGAAGGYPTDPATAAQAARDVRAKCSNSFIIAPNVAGNLPNAEQWLDGYFAAGGVADSLGIHVYSIGNAGAAIARVMQLRDKYARGAWCLSEWGDPLSVESFAEYWGWIRANAPCSAVWVDNWQQDASMNLVNADGTLTQRGAVWTR